jgi:hypothetical protein
VAKAKIDCEGIKEERRREPGPVPTKGKEELPNITVKD